MSSTTRSTMTRGFALGSLMTIVALAGCFGSSGNTANLPPVAKLQADRDTAWQAEEFTFDGLKSSDPDGNVTTWAFSFGDGTGTTVHSRDQATITHIYPRGGEYKVNLTVTDDGKRDGTEKKTDSTSMVVYVNEKVPVAPFVLTTTPLQTNATTTHTQDFETRSGVNSVQARLSLQSVALTGSSQAHLRILDPSDAVLADKVIVLGAGANDTYEIDATLHDSGTNGLKIDCDSGSIRVSGELRVYYSSNT